MIKIDNNFLELSIILPAYKERDNLAILIPKIQKCFEEHSFEIIIVDDNSQDGTEKLIQAFNEKFGNIKLIIRSSLLGIGSAIREGYNAGRGEFLLSSDADLSFTVEDMMLLYKKIQEGYDMVLGYRHGRNSYYERNNPATFIKYTISKGGNWLVRSIAKINLRDFSANFRIIRRDKWLSLDTKENTNALLFEMIIKAKKTGFQITEIPVNFYERKFGTPKLNLWKEAPKFLIKFIKYTFLTTVHKHDKTHEIRFL